MGLRFGCFLLSLRVATAAISGLEVISTSNVQALIRYQAPDAGACSVEVSESFRFDKPVLDVDPDVFPGSQLDSRPTSATDGVNRTFVIGRRAVEQGSDKKWYSRALQADTTHYFRITCGADTATGSFRTATVPFGVTTPWPIPQDPA